MAASPAKAITAFNFNGLTPNVIGTVNEAGKTISLTVPYGTNVTSLVPTITHTGASISPNTNVPQNFTNPVEYTVTAADSTTQKYTVTVTVESAPEEPVVLPATLDISAGNITIEDGTNEGTLKVTYGASITVDNIDPSTVINIAGTTTSRRIIVRVYVPGGVNIKLSGVNINVTSGTPFEIANSAGKVNLILADGSSNTLKTTASNYAGLQKNHSSTKGENWLTITCVGALTPEGTFNTEHTCSDSCGRITATGSYGGAGIGGGNGGLGMYININGGNI
ncbi:MAG: carbohydrate-binding domain-containing protein, partial [Clostridiaceae bacterium]|nr:carbohydrate-binding domain-containing protein [Clostridiaceae bacterium]